MTIERLKNQLLFNQNALDDEKTISFLLNDDIKLNIIKNEISLLSEIASCNSDTLRNYYFQEDTLDYLILNNDFYNVLLQGDFYPNKIKLFYNDFMFSYLLKSNCTDSFMWEIRTIISHTDDLSVHSILKDICIRYIQYLSINFENNIEIICSFMRELPSIWYTEFFDIIIYDLLEYLSKNAENSYDNFFDNSYIKYDSNFMQLYSFIQKFKGYDNLYYSPTLILSLLHKTNEYGKIIINQEEKELLHSYLFQRTCKNNLLCYGEEETIFELLSCFNDEAIEYFFDDLGLSILDENNKFNYLFYKKYPFDKLTESITFANLLAKNNPYKRAFDTHIINMIDSFQNNDSSLKLLDRYFESKDYDSFYRVFSNIDSSTQLKYLNKNYSKMFFLSNDNLFKGMKKESYECFKDRISSLKWIFSNYDLFRIIDNISEYSDEEIINIFSNPKNIIEVINGYYFEDIYLNILNYNNSFLNNIYLSKDCIDLIRKTNKMNMFYSIIPNIKTNIQSIMLDEDSLIDIGECLLENYQNNVFDNYNMMPKLDNIYKYFNFFYNVDKIKDKNILYEILDFYLNNDRYLSTFYLLRRHLNQDDLDFYYSSRRNVITKIIQDNKSDNIKFILSKLPQDMYIMEFFKERETFALYCNMNDYSSIFKWCFNGNYLLDENIICDNRFMEKFIDYYLNIMRELSLVCKNDIIINKVYSNISKYKNMKEIIMKQLNDTSLEFKTYLNILINSGIDVYSIEFLHDMIDVVFFNKRIEEVFYKYEREDLESIKLNILNNLINKSRQDIVSSLTNPLEKRSIPTPYILDGREVTIPTIVYSSEPYNFLIRRVQTGMHFTNGNYREKVESYSTITEKNRSSYYGDSGVKCGYISINPNDIVHINSYDSVCTNSNKNKYISAYVKYPEWVSSWKLNERTLQSKSYNEIKIKGIHPPDFSLSYDEPNEATIRFSYNNNKTLVKILRKSYPNAIENCDDPYSHLQ